MNLLDLAVKIGVKDEASDKIGGISSGIISKLGGAAAVAGKAVGGVVKLSAAAAAAAGGAAIAIGKAALDNYAEFEQLEGGIAKLYGNAGMTLEEYAQSVGKTVDEVSGDYERNQQAQELMMQNAQEAYKTAQMSANEYMETATQFSASLINSLGGDTVEAAKQTDVAMRAISDNVNTFGSDMESVSDAFKGFSKQNYTMLDNLKLGYGGTKEEMERLIADANEWGAANGRASNLSIDSFSDVVTAIEQIQEKQGIAGTTAREAATTIEGSLGMLSGAWSNLLTSLAGGGKDVGTALQNVIESAQNVVANVLPVASTIVNTFLTEIPQHLPEMMNMFLDFLRGAFEGGAELSAEPMIRALRACLNQLINFVLEMAPGMLETAVQFFVSVVEALAVAAPKISEGLSEVLNKLIQMLPDVLPRLLSAAFDLFMGIATGLLKALPELLNSLGDAIMQMVMMLPAAMPNIINAALQLFGGILTGLLYAIPNILKVVGSLMVSIPATILMAVGSLVSAGLELMAKLLVGITMGAINVISYVGNLGWQLISSLGNIVGQFTDVGYNAMIGFANGILGGISWVTNAAASVARSALNTAKSWLGIASPSKEFAKLGDFSMQGFAEGIDRTADDAEQAVQKAIDGVLDIDATGPSVKADLTSAAHYGNMVDEIRKLGEDISRMRFTIDIDGKTTASILYPHIDREMYEQATAVGAI